MKISEKENKKKEEIKKSQKPEFAKKGDTNEDQMAKDEEANAARKESKEKT